MKGWASISFRFGPGIDDLKTIIDLKYSVTIPEIPTKIGHFRIDNLQAKVDYLNYKMI